MTDHPLPVWARRSGERLLLDIHVVPGAKRSEVVGEHGDALKVKVAAPPVDGKANAALEAFVASALGVAAGAVSVVRGQSSRHKTVEVLGALDTDVVGRLVRSARG